jgi:hypothetical protein
MDTIDFIFRQIHRILLAIPGKPFVRTSSDDERLDPLIPRVLLVIFDPFIDSNHSQRLSQRMKWQNVDQLVSDYIADIDECSCGLVKYQVVEKILSDEFPLKTDGFRYDAKSYLDIWENGRMPHEYDLVEYPKILKDLDIITRVENNQIDEAWLFGFPYAGFYESMMAGRFAFYCNSNPLVGAFRCPRRFVIMGFSYERFGGQMLENFCHRAESVMEYIYEYARGDADLFSRFKRYNKVAPGKAEVGDVHHAPNSQNEYEYDNEQLVQSRSIDWMNFPNFQGESDLVNCNSWGKDETCPNDLWTRPHHKWWLKHLPRVTGRTDGVSNNWWKYIINPERV